MDGWEFCICICYYSLILLKASPGFAFDLAAKRPLHFQFACRKRTYMHTIVHRTYANELCCALVEKWRTNHYRYLYMLNESTDGRKQFKQNCLCKNYAIRLSDWKRWRAIAWIMSMKSLFFYFFMYIQHLNIYYLIVYMKTSFYVNEIEMRMKRKRRKFDKENEKSEYMKPSFHLHLASYLSLSS